MKQPPGVILLIPSAREFDRGVRRGIVEYAQVEGAGNDRAAKRFRGGEVAEAAHHYRDRHTQTGRSALPGDLRQRRDWAHRRENPAWIGTPSLRLLRLERLEFSDNRSRGFTQEIQESGYSAAVYSSVTRNLGQSWYLEQRELARWLSGLPKPAGVMACNDDRARMLAEICRAQKIRVPDDVAILGVDNDELVCRSATPPLSSIALATERGGYEAAALLASIMSGRAPASKVVVVHPTRVVPRLSTDILAIADPVMVRALRFIRENSTDSHVRLHQQARNAVRPATVILFDGSSAQIPQEPVLECAPGEAGDRHEISYLKIPIVKTAGSRESERAVRAG